MFCYQFPQYFCQLNLIWPYKYSVFSTVLFISYYLVFENNRLYTSLSII